MVDSALSGLRVVDFSTGPCGGTATTVLADFGATVLTVDPPGGDRFCGLAAAPFWRRGKHHLELDLGTDAGRATARQLALASDVVVVSGPARRLRSLGLDAATLTSNAPALVHCWISGFGNVHPDWPGHEGVVAAHIGRMSGFGVQLDQGRPVFAALPAGVHMASQGAVHGILAALYQRERTGRGDTVTTSLLQGLMCFDLVDMLVWQLHTRDGASFTPLRHMSPMPTLNYHPVRTGDGRWIQCGNLLEHLFMSFLDAIELVGEFLIDDRFAGSPATWSADATEDARDRILMRMQERTAQEWMDIFEANGNVAAEVIVGTDAAIDHRDIAASLVEIHDPEVGATTQIGPIVRLEQTPGHAKEQHGEVSAEDWLSGAGARNGDATGQASPEGSIAGRPLAGVTILDLSTIIAAPLGMSMLADLGARVIKIEPLTGDPFRHLLIEGRMAVKTNAGKESICLDLKSEEGQAILHRMAQSADVLIHNFRGDVPAKLGLDPERLWDINPGMIWAGLSGYPVTSPSATRPATHPVIGAAAGGVAYQAGPALTVDCADLADVREQSRRIMAANEANPDPNTSVAAATAVLLALAARDGGDGTGQVVHIDMLTANAWANGDDFLRYEGKAPRAAVDDELLGLGPTYRLYAAATGWVFLAAPSDPEFARFCTAVDRGDLAERFATAAVRHTDAVELATELEALFATRDADEWHRLIDDGIGCVRADGIETGVLWADAPEIHRAGLSPHVDHARFGTTRRWGPLSITGPGNPALGPAPLAGEHTDTLLTEFGYSGDEIAELRAKRIVHSEPAEAR